MDISSNYSNFNLSYKKTQAQAYSVDEKTGAKALMNVTYKEFTLSVEQKSKNDSLAQLDFFDLAQKMDKVNSHVSQEDLQAMGYAGKTLNDLNKDEAAKLVSEDGFFGIGQTSQRVADFVLMGAGDDIERLRAGREGVINGFNEAEAIWGEKLPEISYKTLDKTLEMIDNKIQKLGYSVLDSKG
ncbi:MAG: hydrogenase-4 component G [Campylobacterota bacterium]